MDLCTGHFRMIPWLPPSYTTKELDERSNLNILLLRSHLIVQKKKINKNNFFNVFDSLTIVWHLAPKKLDQMVPLKIGYRYF